MYFFQNLYNFFNTISIKNYLYDAPFHNGYVFLHALLYLVFTKIFTTNVEYKCDLFNFYNPNGHHNLIDKIHKNCHHFYTKNLTKLYLRFSGSTIVMLLADPSPHTVSKIVIFIIFGSQYLKLLDFYVLLGHIYFGTIMVLN